MVIVLAGDNSNSMPSTLDSRQTCPTCHSRAYEVSRSRYIGSGELTTGYLVRVWSCSVCKREWEDAALSQLNESREQGARRAHLDAVSPLSARALEGAPEPRWLSRAG